MKKHEACFHVNEIRRGLIRDVANIKADACEKRYDWETKEIVPCNEAESQSQRKRNEERIRELHEIIEALDVAGDALTK